MRFCKYKDVFKKENVMKILRKIISTVMVLMVLLGLVGIWYSIEISFDGCCGATIDNSNNLPQALSHMASYLIGLIVILLIIWWGWSKRFDK